MAASWQWENATAGAVAGFATVAAMHSLDVVRTRFQVNDGRGSSLPTYKNTAHAVFTIARLEVSQMKLSSGIFHIIFSMLCG
jgi:solute carrier family 25 folate transporter 32